MSTRSSILLRIRPEDKGKKYVQSRVFQKQYNVPEKNNIASFYVPSDKDYIGIYCHHDGYLSHIGKMLVEHFNDYGKVFQLVAGGDTSYIDIDDIGYYAINERWNYDKRPAGCPETRLIRCLDEITPVSGDAEYIYVFDYETGKWKYARVPWNPDVKQAWKLEDMLDVETEMLNNKNQFGSLWHNNNVHF